jgi:hypothetical protein
MAAVLFLEQPSGNGNPRGEIRGGFFVLQTVNRPNYANYRVLFCMNLLEFKSCWPFSITSRRRSLMGLAGTPP